jgi:hypothetical protein
MMHRQTQIFRIGVVVDGCVLLDLAVLMITAGYMGAVSVVTTVKWFWFLFGMAMFLPVIYSLARTFRETVITRKDPEMIELYGKIAWLTIIMWSFYPVVWLFSEGFASFSVSFEVLPLTIFHTHIKSQWQESLWRWEILPCQLWSVLKTVGVHYQQRHRQYLALVEHW